jgi:hypothetical protein
VATVTTPEGENITLTTEIPVAETPKVEEPQPPHQKPEETNPLN